MVSPTLICQCLIHVALLASGVLAPLDIAFAFSSSLRLLWSQPVPAGYPVESGGLIVERLLPHASGSLTVLATQGAAKFLFMTPDETGLGSGVMLQSKARIGPIAEGTDNTLWIGGLVNQRAYVPGGDIADAYLAKVDRQARVFAEYQFRSGKYRMISSLGSLSSGDVVVAGPNWMSKISSQGKTLWERRLGTKRVSIGIVRDRIIAVTFESIMLEDSRKKIREDVVVLIFDLAGQELSRHTVRTGINARRSGSAALRVITSSDEIYVLSGNHDTRSPRPLEIVRMATDGTLMWRRELPHSIWERPNKTWGSCSAAGMILANGDLLIACAIKREISIARLDATSGDVVAASVPLPECHGGRPAALFLVQRLNNALWLFGSRPGNNFAASCTWLGELTLSS